MLDKRTDDLLAGRYERGGGIDFALNVLDNLDADAQSANGTAAGATGALGAVNTALPHPWTLETDPASGSAYYFNNETGESSWTRPAYV